MRHQLTIGFLELSINFFQPCVGANLTTKMPVHLKKSRVVPRNTQNLSGNGVQDRLENNRIPHGNSQSIQEASTSKPGTSRIINMSPVAPIGLPTPQAGWSTLPPNATASLNSIPDQTQIIEGRGTRTKSSSTSMLNRIEDSTNNSAWFLPRYKSLESFSIPPTPTSACSSIDNIRASMSPPMIWPVARNGSKSIVSGFGSDAPGISCHRGLKGDGINITIPSRDTEKQAQMAKYIYGFMDRHGQDCTTKPDTWKFFMNPSRIRKCTFMGMVKFVATFFVGEGFFVKGKDEEKTLEVARLLKYPGQLSKSHLVTPTAQHAWPIHLTFLAWLCCRAQAMLEPEVVDEDPSTGLDREVACKVLSFKSLVNIFPHCHPDRAIIMDENVVENEMTNFRQRVNELFDHGVNETKEALIHEKNKQMKELERLNKEPNPTEELENRLENAKENLASITSKIQEANAEHKRYSDNTLLLIEMEDLEIQKSQKQRELKMVQEEVDSQKLSHETAAKVLEENAALKKQIAPIVAVNAKLKLQLDKEKQICENCEQKFYEVVSRYSVLDEYNMLIRSLKLEDLLIPLNPFSAKEFLEWLKIATSTLQRANKKLEEMRNAVLGSENTNTETEKKNAEQRIENLRREIEDYQEKVETQANEHSFLSNELDCKHKAELEKLAKLQEDVKTHKIELQNVIKLKTCWSKSLEEWKENRRKFENAEVELRAKVKQELANMKMEEAELKENVTNYASYAAQRHTVFYEELASAEERTGHDDTTVVVDEQ